MNASDRTPADLLRSALAADPGRPLITFYDDATGERVELSVATFANWVAKTANLLQGDLAAEPGDRLALLLPAHWQSAVWLMACHSVGVAVEIGGDPADADLVVSGPDTLEEARACTGERVALALRPLGGRFPQPPAGFADYAVEVPSQGDRFAPYAPVDPDGPALAVGRHRPERRRTGGAGPRGGRGARPRAGVPAALGRSRTTAGAVWPTVCTPRSPRAARSSCAATWLNWPTAGSRSGPRASGSHTARCERPGPAMTRYRPPPSWPTGGPAPGLRRRPGT